MSAQSLCLHLKTNCTAEDIKEDEDMDKKKIAVIGSYAVGMTIAGDHFPIPGETVPGHDFVMCHGGKGSNQAVAAARMGAQVVYGTCIGNDSFGDGAMKLFEEEGMDATAVRRSEKGLSTGVGLVLVNREGENEIVIDFAANKEFSPADVDRMLPVLKDCELLLMQLESSMETVEYAAEKCKEIGLPFVLNPAPYAPLSDALLANCTYITPNQTEARLILGLASDDPTEDAEIARKLADKGVKNVVMTLGGDGCYIKTADLDRQVPGFSVQVVDTTGAGDTFTGAFCVAIAEGKDIMEAVQLGNAAAGLAVTKYGVIESIPYREEAEQMIQEKKA